MLLTKLIYLDTLWFLQVSNNPPHPEARVCSKEDHGSLPLQPVTADDAAYPLLILLSSGVRAWSLQCHCDHFSVTVITSMSLWSLQFYCDHFSFTVITLVSLWSLQCHCDHFSVTLITSVSLWSLQFHCILRQLFGPIIAHKHCAILLLP